MYVLEVRNAELMESITKQAAVMAVQGDRTIGGHLHKAQLGTSFARAYVIPSEHHSASEQVLVEVIPDDGSPGRGRINVSYLTARRALGSRALVSRIFGKA